MQSTTDFGQFQEFQLQNVPIGQRGCTHGKSTSPNCTFISTHISEQCVLIDYFENAR